MESNCSYNVMVDGACVLSTINRPSAERRKREAESEGAEVELIISFN